MHFLKFVLGLDCEEWNKVQGGLDRAAAFKVFHSMDKFAYSEMLSNCYHELETDLEFTCHSHERLSLLVSVPKYFADHIDAGGKHTFGQDTSSGLVEFRERVKVVHTFIQTFLNSLKFLLIRSFNVLDKLVQALNINNISATSGSTNTKTTQEFQKWLAFGTDFLTIHLLVRLAGAVVQISRHLDTTKATQSVVQVPVLDLQSTLLLVLTMNDASTLDRQYHFANQQGQMGFLSNNGEWKLHHSLFR
mmetsp:Transcript_25773/g.48051  ORF Transcript_25773/g.48051 Transcript_25773/m.48051 type:complete len:247 (-) Transcript_25773:405-1145(-)